MFCTRCGFENPSDANFCQKCGAPSGAAGAATLVAGDTAAIGSPQAYSVSPPVHPARAAIHIPKNPLNIAQMMMLVSLLFVFVIPLTGLYEWFIRGVSDISTTVMATDVSNLVDASSNSGPDVGKEFLQLFTLRVALESPLLLLSVYSGVMLWKKRPGALRRAKIFLLALIAFLLCSHLVFPHFFNLSEAYDTILAVEYWLTILVLATCFVFLVSNRVRDYYEVSVSSPEDLKPL